MQRSFAKTNLIASCVDKTEVGKPVLTSVCYRDYVVYLGMLWTP